MPFTCAAQYVGSPNLPCVGGICPPSVPSTATNAVFQNIFVFFPATPSETWDQHLATYIQNNPQYGLQGTCMDGSAAPCLQGLTSEAINAHVQALVKSNYFQAMNNSYGIGTPTFNGELPLIPSCASENFGSAVIDGTATNGPPPAGGMPITYWDIVGFINCQLSNPTFPPPQLNLIFAPDFPALTNFQGPQTCQPPTPTEGTVTGFHAFAPSSNLSSYLNPGFVSGVQQCVEAVVKPNLNPFGIFGIVDSCLEQSVANQCAIAAASALAGCPLADIFLPPGLCESLAISYVTGCVTAAGLEKGVQDALEGEFNFTAIPTSAACFSWTPYPRQIIGGGATFSLAGGFSSSLDHVAVALSHEMAETITDPAGMGWVHPGPFPNEYETGEIADICEPGGSMDNSAGLGSLPTYMPFLFLHVSRYWSNADNQCMPQFDAPGPPLMPGPPGTNGFVYSYAPATSQGPGNSINVSEAGATPVSSGFWGNALSSSPTLEPNVRVTDLKTSPPQQFGNSIDLGGADQKLSYSALGSGLPTQITANANADDRLVLELWDGATGQGCSAVERIVSPCPNWPPPSNCALVVQQPQFPPVSCTATVLAETLAYSLSETPVTGNVIYSVSAPGAMVLQQSIDPNAPPNTCDAITPCMLTVTIPSGNGTYSLTANDTVGLQVGASLAGSNWPSPANVSLSCSLDVNFNFSPAAPRCAGGGPFTLTVNVTGNGTVTSGDGSINCSNTGGTCSWVYHQNGASVTLYAGPGMSSATWTNSSGTTQCTGIAPTCGVIMNQNVTVTGLFGAGTP